MYYLLCEDLKLQANALFKIYHFTSDLLYTFLQTSKYILTDSYHFLTVSVKLCNYCIPFSCIYLFKVHTDCLLSSLFPFVNLAFQDLKIQSLEII